MSQGYALILSQVNFDERPSKTPYKPASLPGVIKDESALTNTFELLNIRTPVPVRDGTKDQIKQKIDEISRQDFSRQKYLIVAILSHGGENNVICAKDGEYNLFDFIVSPIRKNDTLAGKPKIFLVDACRGSKEMSRCNGRSEVFVFYATTDGYKSYESQQNGGYFTQNLCKVINENVVKKKSSMKFKAIAAEVKKLVKEESKKTGSLQVPDWYDDLTDFTIAFPKTQG